MKRTVLQVVMIIVASLVLAVAANALASRQRKVSLVGWYPNATKVTPQVAAPAPAPAPVAAPAPAPAPMMPAPAPAPITTTTVAEVPNTKHPLNDSKQPTAPVPVPAPTPAPVPPQQPDVLARFREHPDKPYIEIAYDDVAALHGKNVLFLDARRTSVYEQGHIAGARPFSVWESDIDEKVNKLFEERGDPREQAQPIVVYCSGGDCEDSHMLAQKLWGIQFNNVYVYKDGFPDWQKRGGAVRTGAAH